MMYQQANMLIPLQRDIVTFSRDFKQLEKTKEYSKLGFPFKIYICHEKQMQPGWRQDNCSFLSSTVHSATHNAISALSTVNVHCAL